jgi:hypothetical protein
MRIMKRPCFKALAQQKSEGEIGSMGYASNMHPNPFFYKYTFHVFWANSPADGAAFFSHPETELCLYETMALMTRLREQKEIFWLYNGRVLLRNDPKNSLLSIIDRNSANWKSTDFDKLAPSFDEDTDPIFLSNGVAFK